MRCLLLLAIASVLSCTNEPSGEFYKDPPKNNCRVDGQGSAASAMTRAPGTATSGVGGRTQAVVGGSATPDHKAIRLTAGQQKAVGGLVINISGRRLQYGSATLVTDRLVLTAGHVPMDQENWDGDPATIDKYTAMPALFLFVIGGDTNKPEAEIEVARIHVNPGLQWQAVVENDLALFELKQPASSKVPDIEPIPVNLAPLPQSVVGRTVFSGGHGSRTCLSQVYSPIRYWAVQKLTRLLQNDIGHQELGHGGFTNGDSGAGVMMAFDDGVTRLVGVVSAHADSLCKETQSTRLDNHAAWLRKYLPVNCGLLTPAGTCQRDTAVWCESGQVVNADCAALGQTCGQDSCGQYRCLAQPAPAAAACNGLDYFGRCAGGVLEWCLGGKLRRRDCARLGRTCGSSADPLVGFTCLGDQPDGGPGPDGGGGDATSPGALTCARLDACLEQAGEDFWALRRCCYPYPYKIKRTWIDNYICRLCAAGPATTGCDVSAAYHLKCATPCTDASSAACKTCLDQACKTYHDACHKP